MVVLYFIIKEYVMTKKPAFWTKFTKNRKHHRSFSKTHIYIIFYDVFITLPLPNFWPKRIQIFPTALNFLYPIQELH